MTEEAKVVAIVVEGSQHEWPKNDPISFEQVVQFVYPDYSPADGRAYTVKYKRGDHEKPEGQLVKGTSVKAKEGMVFSVSRTGQS